MTSELGTTNVLLGIMAATSVLEALVIVGGGVAAVLVFRKMMALVDRSMALVNGIEARQIAPAMLRVNAILDDVYDVTTRVKEETAKADEAIHSTIDRIDDTAARVRTNVRTRANTLVGYIRGARAVLETVLTHGA
jgi:hypothetical protein